MQAPPQRHIYLCLFHFFHKLKPEFMKNLKSIASLGLNGVVCGEKSHDLFN